MNNVRVVIRSAFGRCKTQRCSMLLKAGSACYRVDGVAIVSFIREYLYMWFTFVNAGDCALLPVGGCLFSSHQTAAAVTPAATREGKSFILDLKTKNFKNLCLDEYALVLCFSLAASIPWPFGSAEVLSLFFGCSAGGAITINQNKTLCNDALPKEGEANSPAASTSMLAPPQHPPPGRTRHPASVPETRRLLGFAPSISDLLGAVACCSRFLLMSTRALLVTSSHWQACIQKVGRLGAMWSPICCLLRKA